MSNRTSISTTSISRIKNQHKPAIGSDDNDILDLQKKKQKLNPSSTDIKDNGNLQSVSPPIQFSVDVQVDRIDTDNILQNSCFTRSKTISQEDGRPGTDLHKHREKQPCYNEKKQFYIRKLLNTQKVCKRKNHTIVKQYTITSETIMRAIEQQSTENTEVSDKCLDIFCRNLHGMFKNVALSFIDEEVNKVIKAWCKWYKMYPMFRGTPLMYKCYICSKGWWRLHPFKEHLKEHEDLDVRLRTESVYHVFNVIASSKQANINSVSMDSNCWKCGRDIAFHIQEQNSAKYHCRGCKKSMVTCHRLKEHESMCKENIELISKEHNIDPSELLSCTICNIRCVNEQAMDAHFADHHLVRSDEPAVVQTKLCRYCHGRYTLYRFHECPAQTKPYKCDVCCRTFSSLITSHIHMEYSRNCVVKCMVCFETISQCMVLEHHLKHSKNYCLLHMCYECDTSLLFEMDQIHIFMKHLAAHSTNYPSGQILLPIKCLNGEFNVSETTFQIPDENLNNFMAGLEDSKGIPIDIDAEFQVEEQSNIHSIIRDISTADGDSDVIIVDNEDNDDGDLEPPDELALNSQNEDDNNFDIKTMEAQLDEEIMRDLEMEDTINKIIQATNSYRILAQKESIERKERKNNELMNIKSNMEHLVKKESIENELFEKWNTSTVVKKKEIDSESKDIVLACKSNDLENDSDWNTTTVVKKETSNKYVEFVTESEIFIQEKIKIEPFKDLNDKMSDESADSHSKNQLYECKRCKYKGEWDGYIMHVATECPGTKFSCCLCKGSVLFDNLNHYLKHLNVHDYIPLVCPECNIEQKSLHTLYAHVKNHILTLYTHAKSALEVEKSLHHCKICGDAVQLDNFFKHWQTHLKSPSSDPMKEDFLEDGGDSEDCMPMSPEQIQAVLDLLQRKDSLGLMSHCIVCSRKSTRWSECKRHLIEHLLLQEIKERSKRRDGVLKCYFCDDVFKKAYDWKHHMRPHCHLKVYKCELCSKLFSGTSNLCIHKKTHKMFLCVCHLCDAKFQAKHNLIRHLKLHEKGVKCTKCNMAFPSQATLRNHLAIKHHDGTVKYKCHTCGESLMSLSQKMQHMWRKHDKRRVRADCSTCGARFRTLSDVKVHMRKKHKYQFI